MADKSTLSSAGSRLPVLEPETPVTITVTPVSSEQAEEAVNEKQAHDTPDTVGDLVSEKEISKEYTTVMSRSDAEHSGSNSSGSSSGNSSDDSDDSCSHPGTGAGSAAAAADDLELALALTHVSSMGGAEPPAVQPWSSYVEIPDAFYDRLTPRRKHGIVALMAFCSFLTPVSSTAMLPAVPDLAAEFNTTGSIINISVAMYMLFMGLSPVVWGPMSEVYGRRWVSLSTCFLFMLCSVATALAPNLAAYFVFRILTAFEGTSFILVGSATISDIYRPTERATAIGWFLMGSQVGPAIGPLMGGIIVTYRSWRVIFWLQTALTGAAFIGIIFLLPETIHHRKIDDLAGYSRRRKARVLLTMINPARVFRLFNYPNVLLAGLGSSAIMWNTYALLTPIRYVLNPRFGLTTPTQSGLFYLAPGGGYVFGTLFGGRYADYTVRRWIKRRSGVRVPEDRLRSALPFMGIAMPTCIMVYAWGVEKNFGGIPLAVIMLFLQGVAQLFCFPSLNTYCLDVMQSRGSEVMAGNYFIRFFFACGSTGAVLPGIEAIGVGWLNTIGALFLVAAAGGMYACVLWGSKWRTDMDKRLSVKRKAAAERARAETSAA